MPLPYKGPRNVNGYVSAGKKALKLARKLNRDLRPEMKHATVDTITSTVSSTPTVQGNLANIASGDTGILRDGDQICVKSLYFRYYVTQHVSATKSIIRLVLVKDNQQVADSSPAWTDIYESASITSHLNNETAGRFTILMDRVHTLGDRPLVAGSAYKKMNHIVRYNGAAFTDIQKGGLYFFAISDEPTNVPSVVWSNRLSFTDM